MAIPKFMQPHAQSAGLATYCDAEAGTRQGSAIAQAAAGHTSVAVACAGWTVVALLAVLTVGQVFIGVDPQDEGQLLTYPWLIAHGSMPYRDIWMSYPPGVYAILAALSKLGFPALWTERGLSVAVRLAYVAVLNRAATGSWRRVSWPVALAAGSLLFLSSGIRAYSWAVGSLPFVLGLWQLETRPNRSTGWFLLASVMRFEFGLAGLVALAVRALPAGRGWQSSALQPVLALAGGMAVVFGSLVAVTAGAAWQDIVVDPVFRIGAAHHLPLWPPYPGPLALPLELLVVVGPCIMAAAAHRLGQHALGASNVALLALLPQIYQRADWQHIFAVACISVPWIGISAAHLLRREQTIPRLAGVAVTWSAALAIACSLLVLSYGVYLSPLSPVPRESLFHHWAQRHLVEAGTATIVASSPQEAQDDRSVRAYLQRHRSASDRLFVAPATLRYLIYNQTVLYFAAQMRPATPYLEMLPGLEKRADVQRHIVRDLRHARWVVLWHGGFSREPNSSIVPGSSLLQHAIQRDYRPVLRTPTYLVLKRSRQS